MQTEVIEKDEMKVEEVLGDRPEPEKPEEPEGELRAKIFGSKLKFLKALSRVINEIDIQFLENGVKVETLDESQVACYSTLVTKEQFEEYNCEPFSIRVNLSKLTTVLDMFKSEYVLLTFKDNQLSIENDDIRVSLEVYEPENEKIPELKEIDFKVKTIVYNTQCFRSAIKFASKVSNKLKFVVENEFFKVKAMATDKRIDFTQKIEKLDTSLYSINEKIEGTYAIDYFAPFIMSDSISISFGKNIPLKMECTNDSITTTIWVAPIVD